MTNSLTSLALARTILLMRDEFGPHISDDVLLNALTSTNVALVADKENLSSHSAQIAYATAAMLMARSGQHVHLLAPDVPMCEDQPPLYGDHLVTALMAASNQLLPGVHFSASPPREPMDLEVRIGDSSSKVSARRSIALCASPWAGGNQMIGERWPNMNWPAGGLAAAGIGGGEAFKVSMEKLEVFASNRESFRARFAPNSKGSIALAPTGTPEVSNFGDVLMISGGAIANGALYCMSRVRGATGNVRTMDSDAGDITNLNRNLLMLHSDVGSPKVNILADRLREILVFDPLRLRLEAATSHLILPGARVMVGVDDIPTRWLAQSRDPAWLGIGATGHWSAMASYHVPGLACARCLHAQDDPILATIPTVAFVSFWAGLMLFAYFVMGLSQRESTWAQQSYVTPLRPEHPWRTPILKRASCPLCNQHSVASR